MFILPPSICGCSYGWKWWQLQEHRTLPSVYKKCTANKIYIGKPFGFKVAFVICHTKKPETHYPSQLYGGYSKILPKYKMKSLNPAVQISLPHKLVVRSDKKFSSNNFENNSYTMQLTEWVTKLKATRLITLYCGNYNNGTTTILEITAQDL